MRGTSERFEDQQGMHRYTAYLSGRRDFMSRSLAAGREDVSYTSETSCVLDYVVLVSHFIDLSNFNR